MQYNGKRKWFCVSSVVLFEMRDSSTITELSSCYRNYELCVASKHEAFLIFGNEGAKVLSAVFV
jgi:hypothetical protein